MNPVANAWTSLSRGRVALALAAIAIVVFAITHVANFPGSVSHFRDVTNGQAILDLRASSSSEETWQRLNAMGPAGREAYMQLVHVVDIVFPLAVSFALLAWARFTSRRLALRGAIANALVALPLAYLAFDLLENMMVMRLLLAFPERLDMEGELVGFLTRAKRFTQMGALFAPLLVFVASRVRMVRGRLSQTA